MPLPETAATDDVYDSDDVGLSNSPPLAAMKVNLQPEPNPPPAIPLPQVSPESSPDPDDPKSSNRSKPRPSHGDVLLVSWMAGEGKHEDIARDAGENPLASIVEEGEDEKSTKDGSTRANGEQDDIKKEPGVAEKDGMDLMAVAAGAINTLRQTENAIPEPEAQEANGKKSIKEEPSEQNGLPAGEPMEGVKPSIPPIATMYPEQGQKSPDTQGKLEMVIPPTGTGELPPIRSRSPQSSLSNGNGAGAITLPSITESLGDINHLAETASPADSPFAQSPPARPVPRFPTVPAGGQGSSPKSPNETFRRELPSPGRGYYFGSNGHRRPSQSEGHPYTSPAEYSSSNTETPGTDQSGATPATAAIDRMSIDGITNPQIGGFQCTYPGCTAQPFQTQYLLNSHANVHSSNRPHYCSVKGCPRSEGGKGFKRKNEMIRHGLVHDSPGYVCPFCPDREHKYPRPDNLQRHVRVHHMDKDKDDPQLRDVLSQRPEGPSRGRRRRGGTNS